MRAIIGNGLRADVWVPFQERFGIPKIVEFYGATEGNAPIVNLENKVGSVGRYPLKALTNARLIRYDLDADEPIRDARGLCVECCAGEVGRAGGPHPRGREHVPRAASRATPPRRRRSARCCATCFARGDAWFRSGDLLRQDEEGFFYFVDRIGDTYRWKGENVSTQEVAEALSGYPGLELANVYGVQVPGQDGRAGMAALLFAPGTDFDGARFWRHVDASLAALRGSALRAAAAGDGGHGHLQAPQGEPPGGGLRSGPRAATRSSSATTRRAPTCPSTPTLARAIAAGDRKV